MIKKVLTWILTVIVTVVGLGLLFYFGSEVMQVPPNNLLLVADHENSTYISPECISSSVNIDTDQYEVLTFQQVNNELDYHYDSDCTYESLWPSRNSFLNLIGTKTKVLKPLDWKWNEDGTWNEDVFK